MTVRPSSGQNQKSHGTTRGKDYTSDMKLHIVFCLYALLMLSGIQYFSNGRINVLFDLYHFLKNHLNIFLIFKLANIDTAICIRLSFD